jgi:predicted transcriptional regulator
MDIEKKNMFQMVTQSLQRQLDQIGNKHNEIVELIDESNMCIRKDAVFHSKANAIYSVMHTKNKRMTCIVHDTFRRKFGTIKNIY